MAGSWAGPTARAWTDLRLAVETQTWRRVRTVAATSASSLGVAAGAGVRVARLEEAIGADDGLVVATGSSVSRTGAAVVEAMRVMLGDHRLVVVRDPYAVDLVGALRLARHHAPVVVLVLDAPSALVERIGPAVRELVDARVRLVVSARREVLRAHLPSDVADVVAPATVDIDGGGDDDGEGDDEGGASPAVDGLSPGARAVVTAAVEHDLLGLAAPLGTAELAGVVESSGRGVLPASWAVHAAVREARRAGLVRWVRRGAVHHLVPVDRGRGTVSVEGVRRVVARLERPERLRAARMALARGEVDVAVVLAEPYGPDALAPAAAMAIAEGRDGHDAVTAVLRWYESVAARGEPSLARAARRRMGLLEHRREGWEQARTLLAEAGEDDTDLEVQDALGRMALCGTERREEARRRLALVAGADDDRGRRAAGDLGRLAVEDGRDDDAAPLLVRASSHPDPTTALAARLLVVDLLRRRGDDEEASRVAASTREFLPWADGTVEAELAVRWGRVLLENDDLDGAEEVLSGARPRWSARVAVARLEVEAARERWEAILAVDRSSLVGLGGGFVLRTRTRIEDGLTGDDLSDLDEGCRIGVLAAYAVAAVHLGRTAVARARLAEIAAHPDTVDPTTALRLGEMARDLGDVVSAFDLFRHAAGAARDSDLACRAEQLAASLRARAERVRARIQAREARAAAVRAEQHRRNEAARAERAAALQELRRAAPYFA